MMANQKSLEKKEEEAEKSTAFLSSLPKERGDIAPYLYKYQGCWLMPQHLQGVLQFQKHFQAKDTDVFVVTSPKCGTTWLKALVFATTNRSRHRLTSPNHPVLVRNPHDLVPYIDSQIYAENENANLSCFENPRLLATHLPYASLPQSLKSSACKLVCISRNPKDTFISFWHFANKSGQPHHPMEEVFERFSKGVTAFGPYWDHVLGYWERSLEMREKFLFLKYEDLKEQPFLYLKKLAEFLGCPFSLEEEASGVPDEILRLCSFDTLSNLEVNRNSKQSNGVENQVFFRRGKVGDWKNDLTDEMIKQLDGLAADKFKASGLQF